MSEYIVSRHIDRSSTSDSETPMSNAQPLPVSRLSGHSPNAGARIGEGEGVRDVDRGLIKFSTFRCGGDALRPQENAPYIVELSGRSRSSIGTETVVDAEPARDQSWAPKRNKEQMGLETRSSKNAWRTIGWDSVLGLAEPVG